MNFRNVQTSRYSIFLFIYTRKINILSCVLDLKSFYQHCKLQILHEEGLTGAIMSMRQMQLRSIRIIHANAVLSNFSCHTSNNLKKEC